MKGLRRAHSTVSRLLLAALVVFPLRPRWPSGSRTCPKPTDYVSDYAHVLSPEAIARLDCLCAQLDHSAANAQIAIVTIKTLDGADAGRVTPTPLEDKWKMGRKGADRGLLVFLAVTTTSAGSMSGYGLEGILPDGKVGDIGREMVPDLRANDYDGAVTLAVDEVAQVIAADAKVTLTDEPAGARAAGTCTAGIPAKLILMIILLIFFGGFSPAAIPAWALASFEHVWRRWPWIGGGWWRWWRRRLWRRRTAAAEAVLAALAVGGGFGGGGAGGSW